MAYHIGINKILNSLFPVLALIVLGKLLKYYNLTNDTFLRTSDRLVYFIFFPAMLFWKIGSTSSDTGINWSFCTAVICSILTIFILSSIFIMLFNISDFQAGSFSLSCYCFSCVLFPFQKKRKWN